MKFDLFFRIRRFFDVVDVDKEFEVIEVKLLQDFNVLVKEFVFWKEGLLFCLQ